MTKQKSNRKKMAHRSDASHHNAPGSRQKASGAEDTSKAAEKTFDEVLSLWLDHNRIRLKGGTINKYQNLIDAHISPELGSLKISAISSTHINCFLEKKLRFGRLDHRGSLSASYVGSIMLIINATIKFAVGEQLCTPLKTPILKPARHKAEVTVLDKETQKRLETALYRAPGTTAVGILLSLNTGLRIGEVCALTWSDIDFAEKVMRIRHTIARVKNTEADNPAKTKLILDRPKTPSSVRDIPLSAELLDVLKKVRQNSVSAYVVSDCEGFLSPRTYDYRFHKMLENCGVDAINYHALRHTFATRCVEAGVDVKTLSEILGHSNVGITLNTYVHSSMEQKRCQLEKLTSFLAKVE